MLFPNLRFESVVQVEDMLRLDASKSFASGSDPILDVEIRADLLDNFISVFGTNPRDWHLDYAYSTSGTKTITVRLTDINGTQEKDFSLEVLTKEADALLSDDSNLYPYEPKIDNYLPEGKNSFIYAHRAAQSKILGYLDEKRIWKNNNNRYTKEDLATVQGDEFKEQFRLWSLFEALIIIFESSQVSNSDLFQEKKNEYMIQRNQHRNRASLLLDNNDDGKIDEYKTDIKTGVLLRR